MICKMEIYGLIIIYLLNKNIKIKLPHYYLNSIKFNK